MSLVCRGRALGGGGPAAAMGCRWGGEAAGAVGHAWRRITWWPSRQRRVRTCTKSTTLGVSGETRSAARTLSKKVAASRGEQRLLKPDANGPGFVACRDRAPSPSRPMQARPSAASAYVHRVHRAGYLSRNSFCSSSLDLVCARFFIFVFFGMV